MSEEPAVHTGLVVGDHSELRALTLRAVVSGMFLGGALSLCNIYSGLKIGFTTNMSIASALLAYGGFHVAARSGLGSKLGLQENVVNQTSASAAASIAGAGLVAPIPALTMLTGHQFAYPTLCVWVLSVSALGVFVGVGLRRQMIVAERLPFPYGMATATLLKEMYALGGDALKRVKALLAGAGFAALLKTTIELFRIPVWWLSGTVNTVKAASGATKVVTLKNLGFALDPSVLMVGIGALVGLRSGMSMLGGALLAWLGIAPRLLERGWVDAAELGDAMYFAPLANWMLWPGATLMVVSALTSFALGIPRLLSRKQTEPSTGDPVADRKETLFPKRWFFSGLLGAGLMSTILQVTTFDIGVAEALVAVVLSFALAIVAGRVSGETGIAPIGAMGKITQLAFAAISPGNATANLMSANVTGGAASQCSDMLHDLKTGHVLGAWPRHQAVAQLFGVLSGAVAGSAGYLLLVPDPTGQLITEEWPAPAVAQWKAVAELLTHGFGHLPPGATAAVAVAAVIAMLLATLEKKLPVAARNYVPSAASIGLSFVIPAYYCVSVFIGAAIAAWAHRRHFTVAQKYVMVTAAGLIAGESLAGVVLALRDMIAS